MSKLITHIKRLALTLCLATPIVSWAAEPVVVWDGDFTATQTGYSLQLSGNALSGDGSTITIDQDVGVKVDFTTGVDAMTVIFRYSDLNFEAQRTLATSFCSGADENRTGVYAASSTGVINGIWNTANWGTPGEALSQSSGLLAFCYSKSDGTALYYVTSSSRTQLYNRSDLKAGKDTAINGCTIGGERAKGTSTLLGAATGMKITGIAIFDGTLSESDMTGYLWPSEIETIAVDAATSVSALNTAIAGVGETIKKVVFDVANGVTISVDTAFSSTIPVAVKSTGTVTLSAETQPDLSGVTFDVKGALIRSWLTPGVVGFNFYKNRGNDTTDALATGTWYANAADKKGTSTDLFSDGLSVLSWNCSTLYSQGGYYDSTGEEGTLLNGYLDDGSLNGNGAEVYLTNVPYETYDVIIYAASDTTTANFLAKTVNGTTYTWDATTGSVVEGNAAWGKAALNTPVYGVNTLRIKNLTGALTIYGTAKTGTPRGGISAIQIMPPETPDNVRLYKLTLDGAATTWSTGTWTLNDQVVEAPTAGYVEIVASASTEVTVDTAVSLASLTIKGGEDVVVSIATDGEEGSSFNTIGATVESGVFKQGVASCVTGLLTVDDGATFDMNGLAVGSAINIAGAGASNWPWALGSSSGEVQLSTPPTLTGDAAIGGAGKIVLGSSGGATAFDLGGFTLTKSGSGELYCYNVRTDNGTIDIAGGTLSFNQWTALDGSETIDRHTTVTVRNGATLRNNAGRRLWIDTLNVEAGATVTTTAGGYFGVTTAFNGSCDTTKLQFNDGAVVTLDGNLTLATLVAQGDNSHTTVGSISLALADGTSAATVTVSDTVTAVGTIAVGAGVTPAFTGENDVTATLSYAADPSPTAGTALAFTQETNWKGTIVLDYAITGGSKGTKFQACLYGNADSTVVLGQGATDIFFADATGDAPGVGTKLYFKGNVSIKNGWAYNQQTPPPVRSNETVFPELGADEGVTFTMRQDGNRTTFFRINTLKNFAGTIAVQALNDVMIDNVELSELPAAGALVVKATKANAETSVIAGSVTVGDDTVNLVYGTVGEQTGLMRPTTVTVSVPAVDNTTVTVVVGEETIGTAAGNYDVEPGAVVKVTYAAVDGYQISGQTVYTIDTASATMFDPSETTQVAQIVAQIRTGQTTYEYYTTLAGALASPNVAYGITLRANIDEDEITVSSYVRIIGAYTISSDVKIVDGGQLELTLVTMAGKLTIEENGIYATGGGTLNELVTKDGAKIQLNTLSDTAAPLAVTTLSVEGNLTIISTWGSAVRDTYYKAISYVTENADIAEGATVDSVNEWSAKVEEEGDNTVVYLAITKVAVVDGEYYDDAQDAVAAAVASGEPVSFLIAPGTVTLGIGETLVVSGATLPTVALDDGLTTPPYYLETTPYSALTGRTIYEVASYVAAIGDDKYPTVTAALEAAETGDTVVVLVNTHERVAATVNNNVTLDINGKTMTSPVDDVIVKNGTGTLTIKDAAATPGLVQSTINGVDLGVAVWVREGTVVVQSGVFENNSNYEATLYVSNGAYARVEGGTFRNVAEGAYQWKQTWAPVTLNVQNGHAEGSAAITVTGGNFTTDPANGDDKFGGTFVASGYVSTESAGVWTVAKKSGIDPATEGNTELDVEPTATQEDAQAAADALEVNVTTEVEEVLTDAEVTPATYQTYFTKTAVFNEVANVWEVKTTVSEDVTEDVNEDAVAKLVAAVENTQAETVTVAVPAGLYYKVETFDTLGDEPVDTEKGLSTGATTPVDKPTGTTKGFIRVTVGAAPIL